VKKTLLSIAMVLVIVPLTFLLTGCFGNNDDDDEDEDPVTWAVTFNTQVTGLTVNSQTVEDGKVATAPTLTRAGYELVGWFLHATEGTTAFVFTTPITADTTLFARWESEQAAEFTYTVTFMNGITEVAVVAQPAGTNVTAPVAPTPPTDYSFVGWFTAQEGGTQVTFPLSTTGITANQTRTVFARFAPIPAPTMRTVTITQPANGTLTVTRPGDPNPVAVASGSEVAQGTVLTVTLTAATGFQVVGTATGTVTVGDSNVTITIASVPGNIETEFVPYTVTQGVYELSGFDPIFIVGYTLEATVEDFFGGPPIRDTMNFTVNSQGYLVPAFGSGFFMQDAGWESIRYDDESLIIELSAGGFVTFLWISSEIPYVVVSEGTFVKCPTSIEAMIDAEIMYYQDIFNMGITVYVAAELAEIELGMIEAELEMPGMGMLVATLMVMMLGDELGLTSQEIVAYMQALNDPTDMFEMLGLAKTFMVQLLEEIETLYDNGNGEAALRAMIEDNLLEFIPDEIVIAGTTITVDGTTVSFTVDFTGMLTINSTFMSMQGWTSVEYYDEQLIVTTMRGDVLIFDLIQD